jgi:hypothetical protein
MGLMGVGMRRWVAFDNGNFLANYHAESNGSTWIN